MRTPFTPEQFFDVFRRYNEAVWPAQIALTAVALLIVFAAWRSRARAALVLLSALWLWTGIVYDKRFLAALTPAGAIFGSLFIAQAVLLLIAASQSDTRSDPAPRFARIAGATLLAYALVIYPAIGALIGERYPAVPSFGTPCPTTIFTFGIFCLLGAAVPRFALAIPVLWSLLGFYAAIAFGVRQDVGLPVSAIVALMVTHSIPLSPVTGRGPG